MISHSDKAGARGTWKGTYGYHPLLATCDNTGELLVTIDGAGAGHQIVDHITALNARHAHKVHYSVGFDLDARARSAIGRLPMTAWEPALDPTGDARDDANVAELTGLLRDSVGPDGKPVDRLEGWPADLRVIVRREPIPVGMQVSLFETHDGYRYQVTATNTPGGQPQRLEARHRVHARVEDIAQPQQQTTSHRRKTEACPDPYPGGGVHLIPGCPQGDQTQESYPCSRTDGPLPRTVPAARWNSTPYSMPGTIRTRSNPRSP